VPWCTGGPTVSHQHRARLGGGGWDPLRGPGDAHAVAAAQPHLLAVAHLRAQARDHGCGWGVRGGWVGCGWRESGASVVWLWGARRRRACKSSSLLASFIRSLVELLAGQGGKDSNFYFPKTAKKPTSSTAISFRLFALYEALAISALATSRLASFFALHTC
jgi:hypothetical protein